MSATSISSNAEGELERPGQRPPHHPTFAIVALLILAMASINFINLATARASQRAREVALRKVLGARRKQLVVQFLGESLLITGVSMLLALAMVELGLPWLSAFLNAGMQVSYWGADGILLPVLVLFLVVGLAGGLYPAFYLSRYQPAAVLKANQSSAETQGTGRLRNILVVGQFAVSIGLIICTITVYAQTRFVQTTDLGLEREGLIQAENMNRAAVVPQTETMIREIARVDGVESVAGTSITVATGNVTNTNVIVPGRTEPLLLGNYSVHPDLFATMRLRLLAGRTCRGATPTTCSRFRLATRRRSSRRCGRWPSAASTSSSTGSPPSRWAIAIPIRRSAGNSGSTSFPRRSGCCRRPSSASSRTAASARCVNRSSRPCSTIAASIAASPSATVRRTRKRFGRMSSACGSGWCQTCRSRGNSPMTSLPSFTRPTPRAAETFAGFSALAVVIACLGLFGLAAFTAERRTREIGIRKVFGARSRDIVQLLAWQFSKPVILANLIAWPIAWWVMRDWLNTFDARIDLGPAPFLVAGLIALAIAIGTVSGHALRVSRTNPIKALRYE